MNGIDITNLVEKGRYAAPIGDNAHVPLVCECGCSAIESNTGLCFGCGRYFVAKYKPMEIDK